MAILSQTYSTYWQPLHYTTSCDSDHCSYCCPNNRTKSSIHCHKKRRAQTLENVYILNNHAGGSSVPAGSL